MTTEELENQIYVDFVVKLMLDLAHSKHISERIQVDIAFGCCVMKWFSMIFQAKDHIVVPIARKASHKLLI